MHAKIHTHTHTDTDTHTLFLIIFTSRTRARRVAEVSRFKKCDAIGSRNRFAWSCGRLPCSFPGLLTSCRKSRNHFSTLPTASHLSSTLFNDLHFCAHLLDSPQLSSHLPSPLNSFQLVLTHLTSVPPVQFFLSPVEVTQLQTFLLTPVELPFHSIMVSTFDCVFILVSCTIIQSYWTVDCFLRNLYRKNRFYTAKRLHKESYHTKEPLDKESFTPSNVLHTEALRKAALTQRSYYTEQAPKPDLDTQAEKTRFRSTL